MSSVPSCLVPRTCTLPTRPGVLRLRRRLLHLWPALPAPSSRARSAPSSPPLRILAVHGSLRRLWLCRLGCTDPDAFVVDDEFRECFRRFDARRARLLGEGLATHLRSHDEVAEGLRATLTFEQRQRFREISWRGDAATRGRCGRLRPGIRFGMGASGHVS